MSTAPTTPGRRTHLIGLAAVVVLPLVGAAGSAPVPGAGGLVHGCISGDGAPRVVDPGPADERQRPCTDRKMAIPWDRGGLHGLAGPAGERRGASGWYRAGFPADIPPFATRRLAATCLEGQVVVGGGYLTDPGLVVGPSYAEDRDTWVLVVRNPTGGDSTVVVQALCVDGNP